MARLGEILGHHPGCPGSLCQGRGPGRATTSLLPFVPAVPTVPPGNVQTEATNSTTIRFTWNPPSPQFINGINQGYKVRGDSPRNPGSSGATPHEAAQRPRRQPRPLESIPARLFKQYLPRFNTCMGSESP